MPDDPNQALHDRLAGVQQDLERLTSGLALLGIKPCGSCKKFFRTSEPGAVFESSVVVCYGCIPDWWNQQSGEMNLKQRELLEYDLKNWLVRCHHAEVLKNPEKLPKDPPPKIQIAISCHECGASGNLDGERCRFCEGRGTVWIVVRQ
jgi:hypothetical protein